MAPDTLLVYPGENFYYDQAPLTRGGFENIMEEQIQCYDGSALGLHPNRGVELKAKCQNLSVVAAESNVLAGDVDTLNISGDNSTVMVHSAKTINITGNQIWVYVETGTPKLKVTGSEVAISANH